MRAVDVVSVITAVSDAEPCHECPSDIAVPLSRDTTPVDEVCG